MKKFRTYLIVNRKDAAKIAELKFPEHQIELQKEPTSCYWEHIDGKSFGHYMGGITPEEAREGEIEQYELLIHAKSEEEAEDLFSIIHGGMLIAYPSPGLTSECQLLSEIEDEEREKLVYNEEFFRSRFKRLENIGFGCQFANAAIRDKKAIYAIEKYKISLGLSSFTPHSADPNYGQVFENYDIQHQSHTRSAFAIISAFSVIEELGLEIRSGAKNPRFLDVDRGEWNPKIHDNISKRLKEAGVNSDLTIDWVFRGNPTRIENEIKPIFGYDSQWQVYGPEIRDKTLTFPEAIHNASYLRNFIAAHKFNELTQYISPYDVFNIQGLARQLILRKYDLWELMMNRYK